VAIVIMGAVPPITDEELERVACDLESDRVERKEAFTERDKVAQAVCAFANDLPGYGLPGYLFIGVTDKGMPSGLPITDRLLLDLGGLREDGNILPLPSIAVSKRRGAASSRLPSGCSSAVDSERAHAPDL
jgi:ATP-dependent DNA helicase RecG